MSPIIRNLEPNPLTLGEVSSMKPDYLDHDHRERRKPKYFYHTPFSYIAFWLALLMIIPMSGRIAPVPDARADGANGSCELIATQQPDGVFIFVPDPNDPDCSGGGITGITHTCNCQDGVSQTVDLNASCATACQNHGGECSLLSCFVPPSEEPILVVGIDFFNGATIPLQVYAFDPDTNALVLNESVHAVFPLGNLEFQATSEVLTEHGLPASDRNLVKTWARERVRAQIVRKFVNIIDKNAADRTADETVLYDWLTYLVWKKRIATAQLAWDQYRSWKFAVDFAKCDWHSPTKDGIVTLTFENGTFSNKSEPGCSPGVDGIPGTDPTPNQGSLADVLEGRDDGETCFDLPKADSFVISGDNETPSYDALTKSRCAGVPVFWDVNLAAHPTVEHFLQYGLAIARKQQIITPGFASVMGNTFKDEAFGIGLGVAAGVGIGTQVAVYAKGGWGAYSKTIAPFAGRSFFKATEGAARAATGFSARAIGALAAGLIVFEVIGNIVTAILTLLDIIEFNNVPIKLKEVVRAAAGATETTVTISENYSFTTGKPNLKTLIATDAGKDEIRFALVEAMSPEKELDDTTAPLPDPNRFWAQKQQNGSPVTASPLTHSLLVTTWDGNKPFEKQVIGLHGGWFTTQVTGQNGTVTRGLDLGIDYKDCDGKQRRAWRVGGDEFVSMPMGATAADFDLTKTTKTKEFQYLSSDQSLGCLTARINHAPTATGITVTSSGTPTEGQSSTFTGTASDPDSDTVTLAWDFGDGTSPVTGSSVQHAFADSGSLQVVLTPTDVFGASGTTKTQSITVANVAPTATLPTPTPVNEGFPFMLSLTDPFDPSTVDTQAGFLYAFDCGSGFGSFSSSNTKSCPTVDNGAFTVAAKIKDKDGGENTYTATATVNNVAPSGSLLFTTQSVPEGSSFAFSFFSFGPFDPSPVDQQTLQFAFNCGNGFGEYSSTNGVTCSTTDNGTLSVAGRIKDKDDGVGESTGDINVTNVAPTATFTATPQIFLGESATLAFSQQSDPSSVDTAAGFAYTYDCTTTGTLNVANTRAASATCQYLTTGTFTVGGTISDKDQGANSYTASVTVISPQQAATNLSAQVVALNLSVTRTSDLTTKIDNALQKLAQGKEEQASKQLQDFIKKVNDLVRQKLITAAQGQALIDIANRIIASIAVS